MRCVINGRTRNVSELKETLEEKKERAIIVGVDLGTTDDFTESMEELEALAEACNMEVVCVVTQKMPAIHHSLYIGTGKVAEVRYFRRYFNTVSASKSAAGTGYCSDGQN